MNEQIPRATGTDPVVLSPRRWNDIAGRIERLENLKGSGKLTVNHNSAGIILSLDERLVDVVFVSGTLTAGGCYTCQPVYLTGQGINSAGAVIQTTSLFMVNTNSTLALYNLCEIQTSLHFIGTNTFVQCDGSGMADGSLPSSVVAPIMLCSIPIPLLFPIQLAKTGGSDVTYAAGTNATHATWTYNGIYNGTTLFTNQSPTWNRTFAGHTIVGSNGLASCNTTGGSISFSLLNTDESQGGPVCAS